MDYTVLLLTILKMAVMLGMGMLIVYKISLTPDIKRFLILIIINIALPAIILNGFLQLAIDSTLMHQIVMIFIFSLCFGLLAMILGWIIARGFRLSSQKARETGFLSAFGNTGLIGIPLCASIFGPKGAVFAAVFDAGMALTVWTIGAMFIQERRKLSWDNLKPLLSAPIIAIAFGFIVISFEIDLGYFIKDVTATVAGSASPLAMFYIGMLIMTILKEKKSVPFKLLVLPVSLKLLVFPLLGVIVLSLLSLNADVEQILLLEISVPTLSTASIIMGLYNADEDYGVLTTLTTTLLALITIPLVNFLGQIWIF